MRKKFKSMLLVTMVLTMCMAFGGVAMATTSLTQSESEFLNQLDYSRANTDLEMLSQTIGTRVAGTLAEKPAVDFISTEFNNIAGYDVQIQPFTVAGRVCGDVVIDGKAFSAGVPANNAFFSGWNKVTAAPVFVKDVAACVKSTDFSNNVVFIKGNFRKTNDASVATYAKIKQLYTDFHAAAVVVMFDYETEQTERYQIRVSTPSFNEEILPVADWPNGMPIPVAVVNRFATDYVMDEVTNSTNAANTANLIYFGTEAFVEPHQDTDTQNIIATKYAAIPTNKTIYVTSHYDSVLPSPGCNDNGSGVVMTLEMARAFANIDTNYNIKFIVFGAEEIGLKGAYYYVEQMNQSEISNAIGNYNMDMIATSQADCVNIFMNSSVDRSYPPNDPRLETSVTQMSRRAAEKMGFPADHYGIVYDTTTDHYAFHKAGIPAVEFDWRANYNDGDGFEAYYHTYYDDFAHNFSLDKLKQQGDIISLAVYMEAVKTNEAQLNFQPTATKYVEAFGQPLEYIFSAANVSKGAVFEATVTVPDSFTFASCDLLQNNLELVGHKVDGNKHTFTVGVKNGTITTSGIAPKNLLSVKFNVKSGLALNTKLTTTAVAVPIVVWDANDQPVKSTNTKLTMPSYTVLVANKSNDLNGDGVIDTVDLAYILKYYNYSSNSSAWNTAKFCDVNADNIVDMADIVIVYSAL